MELIKPGINVNFVGKMRMFFWFSITLTVVSLIYIIARGGPIMGIDFAGGTIVQVKYSQATSVDKIREALKPLNLEGSVIQEVGSRSDNEFLLRTEMSGADLKGLSDKIEDTMAAALRQEGLRDPEGGSRGAQGRKGPDPEGDPGGLLLAAGNAHLHQLAL